MSGSLNRAAVAALRQEKLDFRFKALPHAAFGQTVADFLAQGPTVFGSGFVGPVLTLDQQALEHNLATMARWCARTGVRLAPHGKTTMAPQLFERQLDHGAWGITAATLSQLRVYRAFGVDRVLLANQLVDRDGLRWLGAELDADPDFSCACWVDSVSGVELMSTALGARRRPVDVLVELGAPGGRTGARGADEAMAVARAVHASPALRLVGVSGYEAAMVSGVTPDALSTVDSYLTELRALTLDLLDAGLLDDTEEVLVSCGGSSYFDQVTEALTTPWPSDRVVPILRSGTYLTHDDGLYRSTSPLGRAHRLDSGEDALRPAMRIWSQTLSRPEPTLALAGMGRRDVSFDAGLPEPQVRRDADGGVHAFDGRITALADQHAFLELDPDVPLRVGDWIGCGLSHPCTVFDRWQLIPVIDGDTVVDLVRTFF